MASLSGFAELDTRESAKYPLRRPVMPARGQRFLAVLFLAALVLVPLFEQGHDHGDLDRGRPCAACVVAHHSPAASAPAVWVFTHVLHFVEATLAPTLAPLSSSLISHPGRAPPSHSLTIRV